MCGRYTLTNPSEVVDALGGVLARPDLPLTAPRYNIAPTQPALVVANRPEPVLEAFRWGLVPSWADDVAIGSRMINARGESLHEKPAFRDALARRRCLVPADGFFEWKPAGKAKQPIWLRREPRRVFAFAGLWDRWKQPDGAWLLSFTIVTSAPNALVEPIHDRMPVIVDPLDYARWLSPEPLAVEAVADILAPTPWPDMRAVPVSTAVNSPANDGPECIAPPVQGSLF